MKPRRFRLDIVGELEDRPRLLRAYGRVRGAELAVVLRPTEQRCVFVKLAKDDCTLWTADLQPGEKRTTGRLKLGKKSEVQVGAKVLQIAGTVPAGLGNRDIVRVAVSGGRARILLGGDAPRVGAEAVASSDAIARVKAAQRGVPPRGPQTLRGRWTGALIWDGTQPSIELKRKLAAYGTLVCRSAPTGWSWSFERSGRWYGEAKTREGSDVHTLMEAIEAGITEAMLLVKEACGYRDTRRRSAVDAEWAATHPLPEPKERANPTEKLGSKKGCGCSKPDAVTGRPEYARMPRDKGESAYAYVRRLVSEANARVGEGHASVAEELLVEAGRQAASLSGSKAQRVHEHIDHVRGKLHGRGEGTDADVDRGKDAALIGAFRDAVRDALA